MFKTIPTPDTKKLSSMKVSGGSVKNLIEIDNLEEFKEFVSTLKDEKVMVIGEGTNTIFINQNEDLVLLRLNLKEISPTQPSPQGRALVQVDAGVNWDEFVQKYISFGGVGMESLSAIPGTVGAAPVQNIGAYGQEVANFINSINVYDLKEKEFKTLEKSECEFSYRDSLFKRERNRFIILSVVFEIKRGEIKIPEYKDAQEYFKNLQKENPSVEEIRQAIIEIREKKLPNPKTVANCGSFFKNPIIKEEDLKKVKEYFPEIPIYKTGDPKFIKLPAGYILERLGFKNFKNKKFPNFGTYKNNALVVISDEKGEVEEFLEFVKSVKQKVFDICGVGLEEEVNLI